MTEITKPGSETQVTGKLFWLVFFGLTIFVYLFGLSIPLLGPDEPRYAEVAREMFLRGDWVTPTLGGFNWFEKPALLYWFEILFYKLFGISEFASRLGPALCGLGTIFFLWLVGKRVAPRSQFANWTAMIAASTLSLIVFSRGASFDIVVTFPLTASLAGYIIHDLDEKKRRFPLFCFYLFIGIALLAKGLIGLVFPVMIVGFYLLFTRRWPNRTFLLSLIWGIPLFVLVAAIWYFPMYLRHGYQFIDEFIIQQHFQRFTSNKYQHPQPFIFFFWVLPLMTIPWLPLFLIAVWRALISLMRKFRELGRNVDESPGSGSNNGEVPVTGFNETQITSFSLSWLLVPLLFFSFSGSKLPGYILPAVPAAILLSTIELIRLMERRQALTKIAKTVAIATFVVVIAAIIFIVPSFARKETVKGLLQTANAKGYGSLSVAGFIVVSHNAEFYAAGRLVRDADGRQHRFVGPPELREYIDANGGHPVLVLTPIEYVRNLTNSDSIHADVLDENGEIAIMIVRPKQL